MKKTKTSSVTTAVLILFLTIFANNVSDAGDDWPQTVVITNDDGIQAMDRFMPMAEAFSTFAETYVVVPSTERSGTTHYLTWTTWNKRVLEVELVSKRPETDGRKPLTLYAVDGYPADCVLFALAALLKNSPPDLLISGPNAGTNLGGAWLVSGTVGAARVAAFFGVPAIAVSDIGDERPEEEVRAVGDWVAKLAQSAVVQELEHGQYLTVALPRNIRGIRLARRAPWHLPRAVQAPEIEGLGLFGGKKEAWLLQPSLRPRSPAPEGSDLDLWRQDYMVITPMRADEHDTGLMQKLTRQIAKIPAWQP